MRKHRSPRFQGFFFVFFATTEFIFNTPQHTSIHILNALWRHGRPVILRSRQSHSWECEVYGKAASKQTGSCATLFALSAFDDVNENTWSTLWQKQVFAFTWVFGAETQLSFFSLWLFVFIWTSALHILLTALFWIHDRGRCLVSINFIQQNAYI